MADKRGILLPFRITAGDADVATATGNRLRETRISTILGMRASGGNEIGELSWDPDRGSKLEALRNAAASPAAADFAALYVEEALLAALPSESLRAVDVEITDRTIDLKTQTVLSTDPSARPRPLLVTTKLSR